VSNYLLVECIINNNYNNNNYYYYYDNKNNYDNNNNNYNDNNNNNYHNKNKKYYNNNIKNIYIYIYIYILHLLINYWKISPLVEIGSPTNLFMNFKFFYISIFYKYFIYEFIFIIN